MWWVVTASTGLVLVSIPIDAVSTIPASASDLATSTSASLWQLYSSVNERTGGA